MGTSLSLPPGIYAYVANHGDGTITVIDTDGNAGVADITVGDSPMEIAVTPDGKHAYVTNDANTGITVIDTANGSRTYLPIGSASRGIATAPDGGKAYVVKLDNNVGVINIATNTLLKNITHENFTGIWDVAISPDGSYAYVTDDGFSGRVFVINTSTDEVVATVNTTGLSGVGIAVTPDGGTVYMADFTGHALYNINTTTYAATPIAGFGGPFGVAIGPEGGRVYVTDIGFGGGNVSVVNTSTNTIIANVPVGNFPVEIAITPDGKHAYVTNNGDDTVSIVDLDANAGVGVINVGPSPWGIAMVDTAPPAIGITSPVEGATYTSSSVALTFSAYDPSGVDWTGYSLDGGAIVTSGNTTLSGLSNGQHRVTVYANDTHGNMNSSTVYFTVSVPAPTVGVGGAAPPSLKITNSTGEIEITGLSISAGSTKTLELPETEGMPFTELAITVKNSVSNVRITVSALAERPAEVAEMAGEVYSYLEVDAQNIRDADIDKVVITFRVEKAWMEEKDVAPATVALNRYGGEGWSPLSTAGIGEDADYVYYSAESPGLSVFGISGRVITPIAAPPTTTPVPTTPPPTTPAPTTPPPPITPAPTPAPRIPVVKIVVALVLAAIAVGAYFFAKMRKA
jgi:PGF-pre-PGF domain-containing protein